MSSDSNVRIHVSLVSVRDLALEVILIVYADDEEERDQKPILNKLQYFSLRRNYII